VCYPVHALRYPSPKLHVCVCAGEWHRKRDHLLEYYMCFALAVTWACFISTTAILIHNCHQSSIKKTLPSSWPNCAPGPWVLQLLSVDDFCGTRLQNRLDWVAVDSACPPAGSINSLCQIFSLLCWAHSVAEQCINIHSDQSRASLGREYGEYGDVCTERERRWYERRKYSQSSAELHKNSRLSSSLQTPSADSNSKNDVFMSHHLTTPVCAHTHT